jgi:predicted amidohydrolase YtcJ
MMLILYNGNIYTQNNEKEPITALAIAEGRIVATGNDEEILSIPRHSVEIINLQGRTVWPGLTDAHIHLGYYARGIQKIDCETSTRDECLQRVALRAHKTPPGNWILGHGWNQNNWSEGFGDGHDLDRIAPDHPVYLTAKSLHAGWANRLALEMAGIFPTIPDPQNGKIDRDEKGELTGFLFEGAMTLLESYLSEPTLTELSQAILEAQNQLWQLGITGVHDFDSSTCFAALQQLDCQQQLGMRVLKSIPFDNLSDAIAVGLRSGFGSPLLSIGSVKLFSDGALGPHTAAMLQPYENQPGNTGMLFLDTEQIFNIGRQAVTNGLSLAIHAIGDRANREVLDAFQKIRHYEHQQHLHHLRHRIEHVQIIHPSDKHRLAEYGIIASMQPIHATSDMQMADQFWGNRTNHAYALNTMLQQGGCLAFGSDAPVESPNPFLGIHAAVTRCRTDGSPAPEGWHPEQRITLEDALRGFTIGPAFAAGKENNLGKLAPGFEADLIILDEDPFTLPAQELARLNPSGTMVAGNWVWKKDDLFKA